MERRNFLAALAAPGVVFSLPNNLLLPAESAEPEACFFAEMVEEGGRMIPAHVVAGGENTRALQDASRRSPVRKFTFRPHRDERRYAIASEMWDADSIPQSLVDVPIRAASAELWFADDGWMTRADALAQAAALNAEVASYAAQCGPRGMSSADWHMVVEIGRAIYKPLMAITIDGGVGRLDSSVEHPVRLIEPTAAERAAYPLSWTPASLV